MERSYLFGKKKKKAPQKNYFKLLASPKGLF